ncbi:MAG: BamA/TamA family outer membrane protein [Cryomorphaceae bacterium]|nr:BamA/TamA family outer membrane protein [Cryomorphaceae bacterium]
MSKFNFIRVLLITFVFGLIAGCNPTRRLPDGEALLVRQQVKIQDRPADLDLSDDDIKAVLKQKTNRRVLGMRFNLGVYNLVNPNRQLSASRRKSERKKRKLKRKEDRGKELTIKEEKDILSDTLTWRDWLSGTVGEAPVVFDSLKAEKSADQLKILFSKNGFFRTDVSYEVNYKANGRKVKPIVYYVKPDLAYYIDTLIYLSEDPTISSKSDFLLTNSTLHVGDRFDVQSMDLERESITSYLNNRGYYTFTKDYITYKVDSSYNKHGVKVDLIINPPQTAASADSLGRKAHKRYFIGDIYFHIDYNPIDKDYEPTDTLYSGGVYYLSRGPISIRPDLLRYLLDFQKGDLYQKDRVEATYKKMVDLPIIRSVTMNMKESDSLSNVLDCEVFLNQNKQKYLSAESGVTHRDGLFGIKGSLVYSNRNVFLGAETGQVRINGAVEAQQPLTLTQGEDLSTSDVADNLRFNTFEIGPELVMNFHKFIPFPREWFKKSNDIRSSLTAGFNYQNRPDYERQLYQVRYGMSFIENQENGSRISVDIWELSTVKIKKSAAFSDLLNRLDDTFLSTSYQDHLISLFRAVWNVNTQKPQQQKSYFYNRLGSEFAGFGIRWLFEQTQQKVDELGSYRIGDIRFAQFVRLEEDFRFYRNVGEKNSIAIRFHGGAGITGKNLNVLPFEKSFYGGGANGIRAWRPRTLGPGSYRDTTALVTFNNLGDLLLEASAEYRFDLTTTLEGAFFLDVGNLWLMEEDGNRPGAGFNSTRALGELAFSGGLGFRFDFDFFLVRLDIATQLKDPAKIPGERWFWEPKTEYGEFVRSVTGNPDYTFRPQVGINFGIGYPF